jgi:hypothetical protein
MRTITLLISLLLITQSSLGQQVEQKAVEYFVQHSQTFPINFGNGEADYLKEENKIFMFLHTMGRQCSVRPSDLHQKPEFVEIDDSLRNKTFYSDTGIVTLKPVSDKIVDSSLKKRSESQIENDIFIWVLNSVQIGDFYYTHIGIETGVDWIVNDIWIKSDNKGNPLDHVMTY